MKIANRKKLEEYQTFIDSLAGEIISRMSLDPAFQKMLQEQIVTFCTMYDAWYKVAEPQIDKYHKWQKNRTYTMHEHDKVHNKETNLTDEDKVFIENFEAEGKQFEKDSDPGDGYAWAGNCWLPVRPMNPQAWLMKGSGWMDYGFGDWPPSTHRPQPNHAEIKMLDCVYLAIIADENAAVANNRDDRRLIYKFGLSGCKTVFSEMVSWFKNYYSSLLSKDYTYQKRFEDAKIRIMKNLSTKEPLSKNARFIYEKLQTLNEHQAMTTPEIQNWIHEKHKINLDEGTWSKTLRKELEPYGLKNRPKVGYYLRK